MRLRKIQGKFKLEKKKSVKKKKKTRTTVPTCLMRNTKRKRKKERGETNSNPLLNTFDEGSSSLSLSLLSQRLLRFSGIYGDLIKKEGDETQEHWRLSKGH
jgi:hypothetical protein